MWRVRLESPGGCFRRKKSRLKLLEEDLLIPHFKPRLQINAATSQGLTHREVLITLKKGLSIYLRAWLPHAESQGLKPLEVPERRYGRFVVTSQSSRTPSVWEEKEEKPEKVQAADLTQWSLRWLGLEFLRHVHVGKPCGEAWQYPVQELQALYPGRAQVEGIKGSCALQ